MISDATPIFSRRLVVHALPRPRPALHRARLQPRRRRDAGRAQPAHAKQESRDEPAIKRSNVPQQKGQTMRSKLRWMLALGAIVALALTVSACGDDDDGDSSSEQQLGERDSEFPPPTAAPDGAQEGGDADRARGRRRRLHRPRRRLLPVHLHGHLGDAAPAASRARPPTSRSRRPTLATEGRRRSPRTARRSRTRSATTSSSRRRSTARRPRRRQVRDRARRCCPASPNGYVADLPRRRRRASPRRVKEAQDDPTDGAPDISGITAPDDTTLEIKLTDTSSLGVIGALSLPISSPVPRGVREGVRRREPVDLRRAPGRDRSVHDRERRRGRARPATRRARRSTWSATRTGRPRTTDFRPAYLDEITIQEGFTDTDSAAKKILTGELTGQRRLLARRRRRSSRRRRG